VRKYPGPGHEEEVDDVGLRANDASRNYEYEQMATDDLGLAIAAAAF
jgi:hypothetical protein